MNKKVIKLTEADIHHMIVESVKKVLVEKYNNNDIPEEKLEYIKSQLKNGVKPDDLFDDIGVSGVCDLYPFSIDGKWGYINGNNEIIIEPIYDYATVIGGGQNYGTNYGFIYIDDYMGVINKYGEVIIEPQYDDIKVIYPYFMVNDASLGWNICDEFGDVLLNHWFKEGRVSVWQDLSLRDGIDLMIIICLGNLETYYLATLDGEILNFDNPFYMVRHSVDGYYFNDDKNWYKLTQNGELVETYDLDGDY